MKRFAVLLGPLLLLAACGLNGQHRTARLLDYRLQTALAPAVAANRATVQQLPNGARVTLLDTSLFPTDINAVTDKYPDIRASVIEALLDPRLMRVRVADNSALPDDQREARVRNVAGYFTAYGLGEALVPSETSAQQTTQVPSAQGLTITVTVQCPHHTGGAGYGSGVSKPVCD